jgi:hypothetical protein
VKEALLQFSGRFISKYTALLHVKKDGDDKRISGYYGAGIYGFNSVVLERRCPGLGEFAEAIVSGFGMPVSKTIKSMVYTASSHVFPLHNDEFQTENIFRVSISLSDSMPDFVMRYKRHMHTFEMKRGFLTVVIMEVEVEAKKRAKEKAKELKS